MSSAEFWTGPLKGIPPEGIQVGEWLFRPGEHPVGPIIEGEYRVVEDDRVLSEGRDE